MDGFYSRFLVAEAKCRTGEDRVYRSLLARKDLQGIVSIAKGPRGGLRATYTPPLLYQDGEQYVAIDQLSVVYPSDVNLTGECIIIETALVNQNGLVYCDKIGYGDVCRFSTSDEIAEEILRIKKACQTLQQDG